MVSGTSHLVGWVAVRTYIASTPPHHFLLLWCDDSVVALHTVGETGDNCNTTDPCFIWPRCPLQILSSILLNIQCPLLINLDLHSLLFFSSVVQCQCVYCNSVVKVPPIPLQSLSMKDTVNNEAFEKTLRCVPISTLECMPNTLLHCKWYASVDIGTHNKVVLLSSWYCYSVCHSLHYVVLMVYIPAEALLTCLLSCAPPLPEAPLYNILGLYSKTISVCWSKIRSPLSI